VTNTSSLTCPVSNLNKHENMCSVARLALDDAIGRATFAEHLTKVTNELDRLLVSSKVTSVLVLTDESYIVTGVDPTGEPQQSKSLRLHE
jgi:hypothetical protein